MKRHKEAWHYASEFRLPDEDALKLAEIIATHKNAKELLQAHKNLAQYAQSTLGKTRQESLVFANTGIQKPNPYHWRAQYDAGMNRYGTKLGLTTEAKQISNIQGYIRVRQAGGDHDLASTAAKNGKVDKVIKELNQSRQPE